ncbi:mitochondrial distribution and morphology protein family 31/32 [Atractiella rhizophila]|nr:mitochondrial distribution and morphology protein family 31/32 [Atractiella rhizophila]
MRSRYGLIYDYFQNLTTSRLLREQKLHEFRLQARSLPPYKFSATSPTLSRGFRTFSCVREDIRGGTTGGINGKEGSGGTREEGEEQKHQTHGWSPSSYFSSLPPRLLSYLPIHALPPNPKLSDIWGHLPSSQLSWLNRLRLRFKWLTIRSFRRYRTDDWSAFVTWALSGVLGWIVIGTTSFFAFSFTILNSLQMQEYIAQQLGDYLSSQTSKPRVYIVFESAIVPKWGLPFTSQDTKISFRNVYVHRGPLSKDFPRELLPTKEPQADHIPEPEQHRSFHREARKEEVEVDEDDGNYTNFHLTVDSIDVTLSLWRWLDGKGLVKGAEVKGVRGIVDRSHIQYDPDVIFDRTTFRHKAAPGDFHLESFRIEDFLVTVHQPANFRPFIFSIFEARMRQLRKQWLFFDLLSADSIIGQVDNCLYSLHKPQSIGRTSEMDLKDGTWKKMSRFRVDGVPIDHLQQSVAPSTSASLGPIGWITSGKVDVVADIRFPHEPTDDVNINAIVHEIIDNLDVNKNSQKIGKDAEERERRREREEERIPGQRGLSRDALEVPEALRSLFKWERPEDVQRIVSIDLDIRFKDIKATVPVFSRDLSYVNLALVRPVVAFMNANHTLIPIRCFVNLDLAEFDGSWTVFDCGLLDEVSAQIWAALAYHVQSSVVNRKRAQTVSLWTLRMAAQALLGFLESFKSTFGEQLHWHAL